MYFCLGGRYYDMSNYDRSGRGNGCTFVWVEGIVICLITIGVGKVTGVTCIYVRYNCILNYYGIEMGEVTGVLLYRCKI